MKVEVKEHEVIISGNKYGESKHSPRKIKIYLTEKEDCEAFYFSIICGNVESGCLPSVAFYRDDVVFQNNLEPGRTVRSNYNI